MTDTQAPPKDPMENDTSIKDKVLETGAAATQSFKPVSSICAHLNAFHVYADDPQRCVEANHYCAHISQDMRQCLIYDSAGANARLIGIEYMITPKIFATLPMEERKLWHTHEYEVKSGMLIMPTPPMVPREVWEVAETKEMEEVIHLYGKTYHFWQVDRGDQVPLGAPQLMMSCTNDESAKPVMEMWKKRDESYSVDSKRKAEGRAYIETPELLPGADQR